MSILRALTILACRYREPPSLFFCSIVKYRYMTFSGTISFYSQFRMLQAYSLVIGVLRLEFTNTCWNFSAKGFPAAPPPRFLMVSWQALPTDLAIRTPTAAIICCKNLCINIMRGQEPHTPSHSSEGSDQHEEESCSELMKVALQVPAEEETLFRELGILTTRKHTKDDFPVAQFSTQLPIPPLQQNICSYFNELSNSLSTPFKYGKRKPPRLATLARTVPLKEHFQGCSLWSLQKMVHDLSECMLDCPEQHKYGVCLWLFAGLAYCRDDLTPEDIAAVNMAMSSDLASEFVGPVRAVLAGVFRQQKFRYMGNTEPTGVQKKSSTKAEVSYQSSRPQEGVQTRNSVTQVSSEKKKGEPVKSSIK